MQTFIIEKIKEMEENHKNKDFPLSNNGKNKGNDLKSLSKENNHLKNNLEAISLKLDEMIYKSTSTPMRILKRINL